MVQNGKLGTNLLQRHKMRPLFVFSASWIKIAQNAPLLLHHHLPITEQSCFCNLSALILWRQEKTWAAVFQKLFFDVIPLTFLWKSFFIYLLSCPLVVTTSPQQCACVLWTCSAGCACNKCIKPMLLSGSHGVGVDSWVQEPGLTGQREIIMADFEPKVFLGGTCGSSVWRNEVIAVLTQKQMSFFNPQKGEGEWRMEDMEVEEREKKASKTNGWWCVVFQNQADVHLLSSLFCFLQLCKALLFVIEDPKSLYSLIEVAFLVSFCLLLFWFAQFWCFRRQRFQLLLSEWTLQENTTADNSCSATHTKIWKVSSFAMVCFTNYSGFWDWKSLLSAFLALM